MTYHTEDVTLWFDRRLALRPSPIDGTGTFATDAIAAGERLMIVAGGIVYSSDDWRNGTVLLAGEHYNEEQLGPDLFCAVPKSVFYYLNHSCDPNVVNFVAVRDIGAGDELTTDYAYCEAGPSLKLDPCRCGAALCRGRVTGDDWRRADLQQRYQGRFTMYVQGLIDALRHAESATDESG